MNDMLTTEYDGCGCCLVGVRRLSRRTDATNSPERQAQQIVASATDAGGHIIAWADDWEVSGATDPLTRKGFGPWLRNEAGPYDGIVAASVDRVGRNVRDTLNTQALLTGQGHLIITADHAGVWDFSDPNQENDWMIKAWGSQMELRAIQKRNRDETLRARAAGQPRQMPSYGYMYIRLVPMGKVDHVEVDQVAYAVITDVAQRILADQTGKITCSSEAARLTRARVPSPSDRRAELYGRPKKGGPWTAKSLRSILISQAALGYLMHRGRPVLGPDGRPRRIAPGLWDHKTHLALVEKLSRKKAGSRTPKGVHRLSGLGFCGNCGTRLYIAGRSGTDMAYGCTARVRGIPSALHCQPAPMMAIPLLDAAVEAWFLARYGAGEVMKRIYDPGTGYASQIAALEADRARLREDRKAGLYDAADDVEWFRTEYARMGREIAELKALPEQAPGMRMVPTGRTIEEDWYSAPDDAARREILNEFDVRVVLFPQGAAQRYTITGANLYAPAA
ncbi:recombinase family protein [Streptomyces sp. NPDC092296]|uniref:recombinase family protein n=1 Tax=Streptomyces sp. NPDC092296 TaxID=3366012 RepID=UPI00380C79AF